MKGSRLKCALILLLAAITTARGALEWTAGPGFRHAAVKPGGGSPGGGTEPTEGSNKVGFSSLDPKLTGVTFVNRIPPERHYTNQILLNGSGVAAGDVDGDGWCDLFFAGLGGGSALYRNRGDWKFEDATQDANLTRLSKIDATGVALADLDGDHDLDLVVNSVGQGTSCFWNDGKGRFPTPPQTLNQGRCGSSLAIADINGDGALDVYVANYRTSTIRDQPGARFTFKTVEGRPVPIALGGRPLTDPDLTNRFSFVYRQGAGAGGSVFHDELGEPDVLYRNDGKGKFVNGALEESFDWGLSVMMRDFTGDGAPDIYVCNDFATPDRFWINDGTGGLKPAPTFALRQTSLSTMAVDAADINRDGFDDIFAADMLSRERWRRLVQKNEPNPNMHLFVDVEHRPQSPRNTLQLSRGDGTYAEIAQFAGVEAAEWAWASIFLDVDLDGYEDLLIANGFERDYMNMDANRKINALKARGGPKMPFSEQLKLNQIYPRLATPNAAFRNLGNLRFADVSADWGFDVRAVSQGMCLADLDNDGDLDVVINNSNDSATLLRNDTRAPRVAVRLKGKAPNTRGIGARIKVLSQSQEMIAGGRYLSSDDTMRVFAAIANDMAIEVTWRNGASSLVTNVTANRIYEIEEIAGSRARTKNGSEQRPMFKEVSTLAGYEEGTNAVQALGDLDGDGRMELFVAGQVAPGRWPEAAASRIYERSDEKWVVDPENSKRLSGAGPVKGAIFADLDGDKDDDLVLACEWGPVRVYRNDRGVLAEATSELGLAAYTGWWNGVGAGDFDGDGRVDLIASNFGRNTKYERYRSKPVRLVYGDFNGTGGVEWMEAVYDEALRGYAPMVNVWTMARSMPWLLEKFGSYEAFARATIEQALGDRARNAKHLEANWLESTLFLNRGEKFEARPLPIEAQMSPAFAVCAADFDGDGRKDAFLSQNFFGVPPETSRYDAGRGLLLRGDGKGGFEPVLGQKSGLLTYGEQRRASAGDYDRDGRVDLAVEVDGQTKFYRNVTAVRE